MRIHEPSVRPLNVSLEALIERILERVLALVPTAALAVKLVQQPLCQGVELIGALRGNSSGGLACDAGLRPLDVYDVAERRIRNITMTGFVLGTGGLGALLAVPLIAAASITELDRLPPLGLGKRRDGGTLAGFVVERVQCFNRTRTRPSS